MKRSEIRGARPPATGFLSALADFAALHPGYKSDEGSTCRPRLLNTTAPTRPSACRTPRRASPFPAALTSSLCVPIVQVLPDGILHGAAAVAVEHVGRLHLRLAAGLDRQLIDAVDVRNVDIERGRHRFHRVAFLAEHDQRVADLDRGMHDLSVRPLHRLVHGRCAERLLEKVDHLLRTAHGEIRRNGMKPFRNGFDCHDRLLMFVDGGRRVPSEPGR